MCDQPQNAPVPCAIADMILGDCTILYFILRDCRLERVKINAESVGAIFGLTRAQLEAAELIHLGQDEPVPENADIVELLSAEYHKRRWLVGELVLALNFGLKSTIGAFESYLAQARPRFSEMGFAKGDEMLFLGDVLEELASREELPLLAAMDVLEWCSTLQAAISEASNLNDPSNSLRALATRVTLLANTLLEHLEDSLSDAFYSNHDSPLYLKGTFDQKPPLPLYLDMNAVGVASMLGISSESQLIRAGAGSYVEVIFTTLFSVTAFQVFLFLINGCIIQLTELKQRVKVLARKQPPKSYFELAAGPTQKSSPVMLSVVHGLVQYSKSLGWLKEPTLAGLAASNVRGLEIVEEPQTTQPHK
jgi:hypothetical protein